MAAMVLGRKLEPGRIQQARAVAAAYLAHDAERCGTRQPREAFDLSLPGVPARFESPLWRWRHHRKLGEGWPERSIARNAPVIAPTEDPGAFIKTGCLFRTPPRIGHGCSAIGPSGNSRARAAAPAAWRRRIFP